MKYSRIVICEVTPEELLVKTGYSLKENAKWYSKIMWGLLHRFKALQDEFIRSVSYKTITIDNQKLQDKLYEYYLQAYRLNRASPTVCYIGPEDFRQIVVENLPDYPYRLVFSPENIDNKLFGVTIKVIPYMKGILFV